MLSAKFFAMGCQMLAICQRDTPLVRQSLTQLIADMTQAEAKYSRFRHDSELMKLNFTRTMQVSDKLFGLIEQAVVMAKFTNGLISPTIHNALVARGYRDSFQHENRYINQTIFDNILTISPIHAYQTIILNPTDKIVSLPDNVNLDLGGFAKLLTAIDVAQRFYEKTGESILLDAGGDIVTQGRPKNSWIVALPNILNINRCLPHDQLAMTLCQYATIQQKLLALGWQQIDKQELKLSLNNTSVLSTSGIDYRHWRVDKQLQHHLVYPQNTDSHISNIINASVLIDPKQLDDKMVTQLMVSHTVSNHLTYATNLVQAISKLCCLLGVEKSLHWLQQQSLNYLGLSWIIYTKTGYQQWLNPTMQQLLLK